MLTLIEKLRQRKLKNDGAELFPITITITSPDDGVKHFNHDLYAENEEEALLLGEKIKFRIQEKAEEGSLLDSYGLNFLEVFNNKWGLIAPWKDPVYKRTLIRGTRLPLLRFLYDLKFILKTGKSDHNWVKKSELDKDKINKHISSCVKDYFVCAFVIIITTYFLLINLSNGKSDMAYLVLSSLFGYLFAFFHLFKVITKHRILLSWKRSL